MLQTAKKADASTCYVSSVVFACNFLKCEGHYSTIYWCIVDFVKICTSRLFLHSIAVESPLVCT